MFIILATTEAGGLENNRTNQGRRYDATTPDSLQEFPNSCAKIKGRYEKIIAETNPDNIVKVIITCHLQVSMVLSHISILHVRNMHRAQKHLPRK